MQHALRHLPGELFGDCGHRRQLALAIEEGILDLAEQLRPQMDLVQQAGSGQGVWVGATAAPAPTTRGGAAPDSDRIRSSRWRARSSGT